MIKIKSKNTERLISLKQNGELKELLEEFELHNTTFDKIENEVNSYAIELIKNTKSAARLTQDRTIVDSHLRSAIQKSSYRLLKGFGMNPFLEVLKILGTLGIGICGTHIANVALTGAAINLVIVGLGMIGGLLLGVGLFYNKK